MAEFPSEINPSRAGAASPRRFVNPDDVHRLAAEGWWASEIARRIGFDRASVCRAARIHGITLPAYPQRAANPEDVRRLAAEGCTRAEIGRRLGFADTTISDLAQRHRIDVPKIDRRTAFWRQYDAELRRLIEQGASASEAARALGTTKNAVVGHAYRLGLVWARAPEYVPPPRNTIEFPEPGHCLFSFHRSGKDEFKFCGNPTTGLLETWCAIHRAVVYLPTRPTRELVDAGE